MAFFFILEKIYLDFCQFLTFFFILSKKKSFFFDSGIFCIITVLVPDDAILETLIIFLVSKTMISASFLIIYPFAGELYPTQVRGVGIGTSSYIGGLGLIVIPFINYLVCISELPKPILKKSLNCWKCLCSKVLFLTIKKFLFLNRSCFNKRL